MKPLHFIDNPMDVLDIFLVDWQKTHIFASEQEPKTMSHTVDQLRPLVINVGLAEHNGDWNWKDIVSPFYRIFYVTEGTAKLNLADTTLTLLPQHLYFISSFTRHSYTCDARFCLYYVHLYEENQQNGESLEEWDFPMEIPAPAMTPLLLRRLCEINPHMKLPTSDPAGYDNSTTLMHNVLANKQRPFHDKVESRGIVLQLLSGFLQRAQPKVQSMDKRIALSLAYIRRHISESISLEDIASEACLSKDHFIRLFRQATGDTPLQYINQKKIEKAQLMLVTDNVPIKMIAYSLSFYDESYFNRLFKKLTGITPQDYRKANH